MIKNDGARSFSCEDIAEDISAYLDGELEDAATEALEEHLAECDECRALYTALKKASDEVSSAFVAVPPELHSSIMNRIREEKKKSVPTGKFNSKMRRLGALCGAGAVAVICLAVLGGPIMKGGMAMDNMASKEDGFMAEVEIADDANGNGYVMDRIQEAPSGFSVEEDLSLECADSYKASSYYSDDAEDFEKEIVIEIPKDGKSIIFPLDRSRLH